MNAYNLINHQTLSQLPNRGKVLYLYRRVFRMANQWENINERDAIRSEARNTFHKNMNIQDPAEIDSKIEEARSRMLIAAHYRIPFPKKSYAPKVGGMPFETDPNSESNIC